MIRGLLFIVVVASFVGSTTPLVVRFESLANVTRALGAGAVPLFFLVIARIRDSTSFGGAVALHDSTMMRVRVFVRFVGFVSIGCLGAFVLGLMLKWSSALRLQQRTQENPDAVLAIIFLHVAMFGLAFAVFGARAWFSPKQSGSLPRSFRFWQRYVRKDPLALKILDDEDRDRGSS